MDPKPCASRNPEPQPAEWSAGVLAQHHAGELDVGEFGRERAMRARRSSTALPGRGSSYASPTGAAAAAALPSTGGGTDGGAADGAVAQVAPLPLPVGGRAPSVSEPSRLVSPDALAALAGRA